MTEDMLTQLNTRRFPDKGDEIPTRSRFSFAAALTALVLLGAQVPSAQGFGYTPPCPTSPS